jgi:hypothetical protein
VTNLPPGVWDEATHLLTLVFGGDLAFNQLVHVTIPASASIFPPAFGLTKNQVPRNPKPGTRNLEPETWKLQPRTRYSIPGTRNPEPGTQNPEPCALNPQP